MIRKFWNWLTVDRHIEYSATLVEFDKNKSYIISIPGCSRQELIEFKNTWEIEMKKKRPITMFTNQQIKSEEIKNGS